MAQRKVLETFVSLSTRDTVGSSPTTGTMNKLQSYFNEWLFKKKKNSICDKCNGTGRYYLCSGSVIVSGDRYDIADTYSTLEHRICECKDELTDEEWHEFVELWRKTNG